MERHFNFFLCHIGLKFCYLTFKARFRVFEKKVFGDYVDLRKRKEELTGESYITRSLITYTV
jgi:hypothetical protein